jgi:predicted Rossmann fold nucleotide-binding protein DprA/Smf involved in DNA uptake
MTMLDAELAAVALTSRLVESPVKPLSSREFWELSQRSEPFALRGKTAKEIASELAVSDEGGARIAGLFDRASALAFAIENLDHSGIWTITGLGRSYPERLRARLGYAAPVVLYGVGNIALLDTDGVGVVGSRNVSEEGSQVSCAIAEIAARSELTVVSGAARGVDSDAMNRALEVGGQVVGVLADSIERVITRPSTRRGDANDQICLVTPFTPAAPFSVGNAMGRNKLIYGLSRCTVVVASDHETGGTWAGAVEALKNSYGRVASWVGSGRAAGPAMMPSSSREQLNCVTSRCSMTFCVNLSYPQQSRTSHPGIN